MGNKRITDMQKNEIKRNNSESLKMTISTIRTIVYVGLVVGVLYFIGGVLAGNKLSLPGYSKLASLFSHPAGTITTSSRHDLVDKIQKSRLNLVEYPYSGFFEEKDSKDKTKYYVYFTGSVKAGIDVADITDESIVVDEEKKEIVIHLPEPIVEEPFVDHSKMKIMFAKDKYNTPDVDSKAYSKAIEVMKEQSNEDEMKENARIAAKMFIEDVVKAIVNGEKNSYKVIVD